MTVERRFLEVCPCTSAARAIGAPTSAGLVLLGSVPLVPLVGGGESAVEARVIVPTTWWNSSIGGYTSLLTASRSVMRAPASVPSTAASSFELKPSPPSQYV
ncbi:hypothetical protein ACIQU4_34810 [Streptomyces sp. NPDC090741]|uniref:hypothetical protein n=1 Tax=Streptomyces sp. NPDC090741 TaxID=3365967 RepID=UPI00381586C2